MAKVKVHLCPRCTEMLAGILRQHGQGAMATASGAVLQNCPECRKQLPADLRDHDFETALAQPSERKGALIV